MTQGGLPRGHALLLTVVAFAAAAETVFAAWAASQSAVLQNPGLQEAWRPAFVATYAAAGVYLWQRRPRSLTGPRIAGLGLLYGLTSLNAFSNPWLFCAGRIAVALFVCGMATCSSPTHAIAWPAATASRWRRSRSRWSRCGR